MLACTTKKHKKQFVRGDHGANGSFADPDPHHFGNPDPDWIRIRMKSGSGSNPYQSKKPDSNLHQSIKSGAVEAQIKPRSLTLEPLSRTVEEWRLTMELWRV
jgi:hypothetical protein